MNDRVELPAERCETCRFWWEFFRPDKGKSMGNQLDNTDEPWGYCRRYPPAYDSETHHDDHSTFNLPITEPGNWCGEYQPVPPPKPQLPTPGHKPQMPG